MKWIDKNVEPFPEFTPENGKDILAAWIYDGHIEGIEWYTVVGGEFWNQNSNNLNEFDDDHELRCKHSPTHWMLVPREIDGDNKT